MKDCDTSSGTRSRSSARIRLLRRCVAVSARGVGVLMIAFAGLSVNVGTAAAAGGTISVTPSTGVVAGRAVTITGSGWVPNSSIGWCQGVPSPGLPSEQYCDQASITLGTADFEGGFSVSLVLTRYLDIPALGQRVDCGDPAVNCIVGAADQGDVGGTGIAVGLSFAPIRPTVLPHLKSVVEGNSGFTIVNVPVTLSEVPIRPVTVNWRTLLLPRTRIAQATPTTDYTPAAGTTSFAPGETAKTVSVKVVGDTLVERDEYVVVSFSNPVNARIGGIWGLGFAVITNDD